MTLLKKEGLLPGGGEVANSTVLNGYGGEKRCFWEGRWTLALESPGGGVICRNKSSEGYHEWFGEIGGAGDRHRLALGRRTLSVSKKNAKKRNRSESTPVKKEVSDAKRFWGECL